jgi:pilus assembly protein Flp/PilA
MFQLLNRFCKDQSGATAIEYGLIAAGISVVIIATVQALGGNLNGTFTTVSNALKEPAIEALETDRASAECKLLRHFCGCQAGTFVSKVPVCRSIFGLIPISAPNWDNLRLKIFKY